jgi:hypothetical protein
MPGESREYRPIARALVAAVCLAALVVIVLVLSGSETDLTAERVLVFSVALALFSLTGAAGMKLAARGPVLVTFAFGYVTVILSLLAFGEAIATFWSEDWLFGDQWRTAVETGLVALAAANISLLLASERPEDGGELHAARGGAVIAIVVLTVLALIEISSPGRDVGVKPMAVFAVLYVLGAVLIPLLRQAQITEP